MPAPADVIQHVSPKGVWRVTPVPKVRRDRASALADATPAEMNALLFIAGWRLLHGEGPTVRAIWRQLWPDRPIPREGAYGALLHLARFGVYWKPGLPGSVWIARPVYVQLRPRVVAALKAAGLYPPRDRGGRVVNWRGPKGPAK